MGLSQNIATLRKNMGISQEKLAERCGVSRQSVTKWECGESEPSIDKLCRLSEVFSVSLDELIKYNITPKTYHASSPINDFDNMAHVTMYIHTLIKNPMWYSGDADIIFRLSLLSTLYMLVKKKFYTDDGVLKEKYLVSNTDEEDRTDFVRLIKPGHIDTPFDNYIAGKCEVDEAVDAFIEKLDERQSDRRFKSILKSEIMENYCSVRGLSYIDPTDPTIDSWTQKLINRKLKWIDEQPKIEEKSLANKLILFYRDQIREAVQHRNQDARNEIEMDLEILKDYFYYKAESSVGAVTFVEK